MSEIGKNLQAVRDKITATVTSSAAGRAPGEVQLIAVSKGHGEEAIRQALAAGQRVFGENRVQEAKAKYAPLRAAYADLRLHLIGPLQTNKAEDAVRLFDVIETLDRLRLAKALATAMHKTGHKPELYIEVNIGAEAQKAGIAPEGLGHFLNFCRTKYDLSISGLMCIPPQDGNPEPYFRKLQQLAAQQGLPHLSMGMSADFEIAVRCGATEVRVGSAIFGARKKT